jgi:hypothetical protein
VYNFFCIKTLIMYEKGYPFMVHNTMWDEQSEEGDVGHHLGDKTS